MDLVNMRMRSQWSTSFWPQTSQDVENTRGETNLPTHVSQFQTSTAVEVVKIYLGTTPNYLFVEETNTLPILCKALCSIMPLLVFFPFLDRFRVAHDAWIGMRLEPTPLIVTSRLIVGQARQPIWHAVGYHYHIEYIVVISNTTIDI